MICRPCMDAADARAPRTAHCDDPGCTCGHRVADYGNVTQRITAATTEDPAGE